MRLSLFGAAPDTGNLGVSALCYATLYNFLSLEPKTEFTVFDHGRGRDVQSIAIGPNNKIKFYRQGAANSRRYYRAECLKTMRLAGYLGGLGNPGIKTIANSDAVLDISGGDSFTDLYGHHRFETVVLPKLITLQQKKHLVLLPQTYGPFTDSQHEKEASRIVKNSLCAWARDARSFEVLKHLLGSSFDASRHQCGVDMAFGLPAVQPAALPQQLSEFLARDTEIIGVNVSGLIYNDFSRAKERFGFKADYKQIILGLVQRFLSNTDCSIALIAHVATPRGHFESDLDACRDVLDRLGSQAKDRLMIMPEYNNPCEIKWIISKMNWFCGTRMHATIAALSSAVPAAAIAYSPKTLGVFESCGQGEHVADPQQMGTEDVIDLLWNSWMLRRKTKYTYASYVKKVKSEVIRQTSELINIIKSTLAQK